MRAYEAWLGVFLAIAAIIGFVHYAVWRVRDLAHLDEGLLVGDMKGWEIRVVDDPKDGRSVGIAIDQTSPDGPNLRFYAVLTAAQARELAQWLRVAAAPGPTLAVARLNVNRKPGP
ncbi:MAG: hypothetical protein ACXWG1_17025 [Usitatibacter sp.]